MSHVLLLGAGFSRNWGGWLASEVFEFLLGCPELDDSIRQFLWTHRRKGGFEEALSEIQKGFLENPRGADLERLSKFQAAISRMFNDMNRGLGEAKFEPQNQMASLVRTFLVRFDAIFTLNQDLLLEQHYLNGNVALGSNGRWAGWQMPGMQLVTSPSGFPNPMQQKWSPLPAAEFRVAEGSQPYFKLHGSSNWLNGDGGQLLVMGGNKATTIEQHGILSWNKERFRDYLMRPGTRLMVIGYSFGDEHINKTIGDAIDQGLKVFVVDPLGIDVVDKNRKAAIYAEDDYFRRIQPHFIGASRRSIKEIFGGDKVEHSKVMRFFASA